MKKMSEFPHLVFTFFTFLVCRQVACNNGTSALVARDGAVYLFGKDATHSDYASGLVTDLKGIHITQVCISCYLVRKSIF